MAGPEAASHPGGEFTDEDYRVHAAKLPRRAFSGRRLAVLLTLFALAGAAIFTFSRLDGARTLGGSGMSGPEYVEVPEMMVNLNAGAGEAGYLKVRVMLEAPSPADAAALQRHLPAVIDSFQGYLRELRPEDLAGSAGTFRVKEAMLRRVNQAAHPARASDVLVQEMIQQ